MVNGYVASGDIAPQIIFANGPAATSYGVARDALYGWGYTPTFQVDGVNQQIGWTQSVVQGFIDSRLTVPSYVDIQANVVGNSSGGTVYFTITVEQDPGVTGPFKLWSAIVESHEIATSDYGVYSGQELMWEPRAFPTGSSGTVVSITGPYPQTINFSGPYTLDPVEHTFDNLNMVAYVQSTTGTFDVLNASFTDLPDTATDVEDMASAEVGTTSLSVWPNPACGSLNLTSILPGGTSGQVIIMDITGRTVAEFQAGGVSTMTMEEAGIYFARLLTATGEVATTRFTVVR